MTDEDRPDQTPAHDHGKIDQVDLQLEMQRSYLDYAMAVIIGQSAYQRPPTQTPIPPKPLQPPLPP